MTGFICHDDYLNKTAKLSDEELGRLFRACMVYHATGEVQDLDGRESIAFDFLREDIDRAEKAYQDKCETNRRNRLAKTTTVNDRKRPSTNDNDRQRTSIIKEQEEEQYIEDDEEEDDDNPAREADDQEAARQVAIETAISSQFGRLPTPAEVTQISLRAKLYGQSPVMAALAVKIAAENSARNITRYVTKVFDEWKYESVTTPDEAEEYAALRRAVKDGLYETDEIDRARERRKAEHAMEAG